MKKKRVTTVQGGLIDDEGHIRQHGLMLSVILACNCEDVCPVGHEGALYQVGIATERELCFYRRELAPSLFLYVNLLK